MRRWRVRRVLAGLGWARRVGRVARGSYGVGRESGWGETGPPQERLVEAVDDVLSVERLAASDVDEAVLPPLRARPQLLFQLHLTAARGELVVGAFDNLLVTHARSHDARVGTPATAYQRLQLTQAQQSRTNLRACQKHRS